MAKRFAIRFKDSGDYNWGDGFEVSPEEATRYASRADAEAAAESLYNAEVVPAPPTPKEMRTEAARLRAELAAVTAERDAARATLAAAIDLLDDALPYVDEHFRKKWGHDNELARIKAAASAGREEGGDGDR